MRESARARERENTRRREREREYAKEREPKIARETHSHTHTCTDTHIAHTHTHSAPQPPPLPGHQIESRRENWRQKSEEQSGQEERARAAPRAHVGTGITRATAKTLALMARAHQRAAQARMKDKRGRKRRKG